MDRPYADKYAEFEESHWWFRARRVILRALLEKEIGWRPGMNVLEIGVGPGLNLYSLYPGGCRLQGLEPDVENARIAGERGPVAVSVGTVENMPIHLRRETFDVITMFDVLEHIEDDQSALQLLKQRLAPDGYLILSVPAYNFLWSEHDIVNQHFRRYTAGQLVERLRNAGFKVQRATYFNFFLFPPIAIVRLLARLFPAKSMTPKSDFEKQGNSPFAPLLFRVFAAEAQWLKRWFFPFGVSIFAVARPNN